MSEFKSQIEAVLAIIESFSDEEKRLTFSLLSIEMQKQVIGYINVYAEHYECAISEIVTYQPLSSFGVTETHLPQGKLKRFPDNKTLYDMLKDPFEFHKWCLENNIK